MSKMDECITVIYAQRLQGFRIGIGLGWNDTRRSGLTELEINLNVILVDVAYKSRFTQSRQTLQSLYPLTFAAGVVTVECYRCANSCCI